MGALHPGLLSSGHRFGRPLTLAVALYQSLPLIHLPSAPARVYFCLFLSISVYFLWAAGAWHERSVPLLCYQTSDNAGKLREFRTAVI